MSDTPRTDAVSYISSEAGGERVVLAHWMESIERDLAAVTAERDRMRPVVEAAQKWRHSNFAGDESELTSAIDTYEAALQVVEQPTKKTCPDPQACLHQGCNQTNDGSLCVSGQLQIIDADEAAK